MSKVDWEARRRVIERLVAAGLDDRQIGALLRMSNVTVYQTRKRFGIPAAKKQGPQPKPERKASDLPTYIDEEGRVVTRCPTRYAEGAYVAGRVVRPGRKGGRARD